MINEYYQTKESVDEYFHKSKGIDGSEIISKLKTVLPQGKSILELGTGPGKDFDLLSEGYKVTGSDYSKEFISRLNLRHPDKTFLHLDASELNISGNFDCIYSNKVLHHLSDEQLIKSIERQYQIITSDGIVCHSFWKGDGDEIFKGMFVNYHSLDEIRILFKKYFEETSLTYYTEFELKDSILFIGRRKD